MSEANITINRGSLIVHVAASDEPDPYGQGGCSIHFAEIIVSDGESRAALKKSFKEKSPIIVRCGGLEIEGVIYRYSRRLFRTTIVMAVDRMHKDKPR